MSILVTFSAYKSRGFLFIENYFFFLSFYGDIIETTGSAWTWTSVKWITADAVRFVSTDEAISVANAVPVTRWMQLIERPALWWSNRLFTARRLNLHQAVTCTARVGRRVAPMKAPIKPGRFAPSVVAKVTLSGDTTNNLDGKMKFIRKKLRH